METFLFLIASEGLGILMDRAVEEGIFSGFVFDHQCSLLHLQYADDTILVGKASFDNLWVVKDVVRYFEMASGLKINFSRSCLFGLNVGDDSLRACSNFLCCKTG